MTRREKKPLDYAAVNPTPVHRRPGFDFSLTGLVYSAIMMFMGFAAVNLQASLLFGVFGLMIGIHTPPLRETGFYIAWRRDYSTCN